MAAPNSPVFNSSCSSGNYIRNASMASTSTLGDDCVGSRQMTMYGRPQYGFPLGVTLVGLVVMVTLFFVGMAVLLYCYLRILSGFSVRHNTTTIFGSSPSSIIVSAPGSMLELEPSQHQHNDQQSHQTTSTHAQDHKIIAIDGIHPNNHDPLAMDKAFIFITPPGNITPSFIGFPIPHYTNFEPTSPRASHLKLSFNS